MVYTLGGMNTINIFNVNALIKTYLLKKGDIAVSKTDKGEIIYTLSPDHNKSTPTSIGENKIETPRGGNIRLIAGWY